MKYILTIILLILPTITYSHGGSLDQYGCHNDNKNKTYHCHQGKFANQQFSTKSAFLKNTTEIKSKSPAKIYQGKVISVNDGDTLKILINNKQIKVRLAEIDAPESDQPYGNKAKRFLGNLVFGKTVKVKEVTWDRYGRLVARIYLGDIDVSAEIVRAGYAWAYRRYLTDQMILRTEFEAKRSRKGLWASDGNVAPWEWRSG